MIPQLKRSLRYALELLQHPSRWRTTLALFRVSSIPRFRKGQVVIDGHKFAFPDSASFVFMYREIFEKRIYDFSSDSQTPYIVDGGANIGLATIFFKSLYPKATIVAFEPDSEISAILRENIELSRLTSISVIEKGLWSSSGTVSFSSDGADGGRITGNETDSSPSQGTQIPTVRLRDYLNRTVDFLKLDIEGSEGVVLEDCKDELKNVQHLFVEFHSFINRPQDLDRILTIMSEAGFRYYIESIGVVSKRPFISREENSGIDLQLNIFAYRT